MINTVDLSHSPGPSREQSIEPEESHANTSANKNTAENPLEDEHSMALDGVVQVTSDDDPTHESVKEDPSQAPTHHSVAVPHYGPRSGEEAQPSTTETVKLQPSASSDHPHLPPHSSSMKEAKSENSQSSQSLVDDPLENMEAFDWRELEARFHEKQAEFAAKEQAIVDEFQGLSQSFGMWAAAGSNQESNRTFKRLKTQMTLVQHHEDGLAAKRQHYIKVVDAFKSALELLAS
ncbi:hypothetical protein BDY17DRAFT_310755 [Neohortaea acidophila]|uniref:Uncharacterized protein n=1 Tax=Neohortaea acidophila TaxID=245834 RepID=A0A6A6PRE7_9PEZI|nr:uncharacterized protein BDY17DRAFT_310755 [Neohortaea acidophila]KAF2482224.1 hypothetical protein BDY17DRAFT_310755 [Neohortaea acidophila]